MFFCGHRLLQTTHHKHPPSSRPLSRSRCSIFAFKLPGSSLQKKAHKDEGDAGQRRGYAVTELTGGSISNVYGPSGGVAPESLSEEQAFTHEGE